jgi:hypothetical protein
MSDRRVRRRSSALERDLARLADGTLVGPRRELLNRLLDGSPELQRRLDEQRRARTAVRSSAARERAPLALRTRHHGLTTRARQPLRAQRWLLGPGLAGTLAALAAIIALAATGPAAPTVALAATVATRPAVATVAEPADGSVTLPRLRAAGAGGLPFPYWEDRFGWHAIGARADRVDGRELTTVFYRRRSQRIAYTIVSGRPLPAGAPTRALALRHLRLTLLTSRPQLVLTWLRRGHTCVVSGRDVPLQAVLELATWRAHGRIPY